ncbi:hypothetical protein FP435_04810 [Lactobacillus sp. PV037]|uniref:hypothetical protein n=1 Tax=Lactobacillus sp. PV037 TaxID=2594496 RepID=UPI0022400D3D|nr:hypothetical protein [Lactobacillus sp. PV037]QNQ83812.1 hypothetical protein FP435_04810 [Lactobacillus sp. PV037]
MYTINNLVATLLTAGGLGYINYGTLIRMGVINKTKDKSEMLPLCLIFSIIDFSIYLLIQECLNILGLKDNNWNILLTILITMLIVLMLTVLAGRRIAKMFNKLINRSRQKDQKGKYSHQNPFRLMLNTNNQSQAYVYDFNYQPLGYGYVLSSSASDDEFQLNLDPYVFKEGDTEDELEQLPYKDLIKNTQTPEWKKDYNITQHINFNQKFIVVLLDPR